MLENPAENNPGGNESDFGDVFTEVNTEKDPLELEYDNFKSLMKKEKTNVFAALLDYENGKRKPLADIYKVHPELKNLAVNGLSGEMKETAEEERVELVTKYKKEVIGLLYANIMNLKNGVNLQPGDLNLLLDNGDELNQNFEALKTQQPNQEIDLFPVLEGYLAAKKEAAKTDNPEVVAMYMFFDLNNPPLEKLISGLDKLSDRFKQDVVTNIVSRLEDERKLTELSKKTEPIRQIADFYGTANDHLSLLLDDFQKYMKYYDLDKSTKEAESLAMLKDTVDSVLKNELRQINKVADLRRLEAELGQIKEITARREAEKKLKKLDNNIVDLGNFKNYRGLKTQELESLKGEYEQILKLPPNQIIDLKILSSLGELVEKRVAYFHQVLDQHAKLSKKYTTEYSWQ